MEQHKHFKYESASLFVKPFANAYKVMNVNSTKLRQGHATVLMQQLIDWADANDFTLVLEARQYLNARGMSTAKLVLFYEKFGFFGPRQLMVREPNREKYTDYNETHLTNSK